MFFDLVESLNRNPKKQIISQYRWISMASAKPQKPPASRLIVGLTCILIALFVTAAGFMIGNFEAGLMEWFPGGVFFYMRTSTSRNITRKKNVYVANSQSSALLGQPSRKNNLFEQNFGFPEYSSTRVLRINTVQVS
jgi:hypothetical protein